MFSCELSEKLIFRVIVIICFLTTTIGFIYYLKNMYLMIFSQGSYGIYQAGNAVYNKKANYLVIYWYHMCLLTFVFYATYPFLGSCYQTNAVSEGCYKTSNKIIWKAVVREYLFNKVVYLQLETLEVKKALSCIKFSEQPFCIYR